jgi:hypothetical protein
MADTTKSLDTNNQFPLTSENQEKRHLKVNDINYRNNIESNYTEIIEELDKNYDYANNKDYYWSEPELSLLYGTPLYEAASPSQKLALNHLYWTSQYDHIAASEGSTILYNQVTAGVFAAVGGYTTLCQELDLETEQERSHIHAFQKICYNTKVALLGKSMLGNLPTKTSGLTDKSLSQQLIPEQMHKVFSFDWTSSPFSNYDAFRFVTQTMLKEQSGSYSLFLKQLEKKGEFVPAPTKGYFGVALPRPLLQFFTFNWGSSAFLACQHYAYRFSGNMGLKNYEYSYSKYFKELERKGEFIPIPTAVSHYHLLDESFHTTTSQLISRDMYKDFPKPTVYEKFVANQIMSMMQRGFLNELSAGLPATFRRDAFFMPLYYKLLRSPIFDMSNEEALNWMEKCLCQDHEGFHANRKYYERLHRDLCRFTENLDYLWPVNREMRIMGSGGSIKGAIQNNIKEFKRFRASVN